MMNAFEIAEITKCNNERLLEIEKEVLEAAERGKFNIRFGFIDDPEIKFLEKSGYVVSYDRALCEYTISWS